MSVLLALQAGAVPDEPRATVERSAARGLLQRDGLLLLLRSKHGDYKFPGGGVQHGESAEETLRREVLEECGAVIGRVGELVVRVIERRPALEAGAVFVMTSSYHRAELIPAGAADLDGSAQESYERDLELTPVWVDPLSAWTVNARLLRRWSPSDVDGRAPWLPRETRVLAVIASKAHLPGGLADHGGVR